MKLARLSATTRAVCLLGPMAAAGLFVVARVVMPAVWARPRLARIVAQPCMLKSATGVPCPFCGGTRSVVRAAHGEWMQSVLLSPLGALLVLGGPLVALWLGLCAATGLDLGLGTVGDVLSRRSIIPRTLTLVLGLWLWKILVWLCLGV